MKTTNVLAEILVVGGWSLLWVAPLLIEKMNITEKININFINSLLIVCFIYFIGMIVNFLGDLPFSSIDKIIAKKYGGKENIQKIRNRVFLKSEQNSNYLFQRRSFVRIYRSNSLTFFIIIILSLFNYYDNILSLNKASILLFSIIQNYI